MKIVVIGTRGIPKIMGGVETHCEELYPRIAKEGHDVTIIRRKTYVHEPEPLKSYQGVNLVDLYNPKSKSFEAIVHTFLAVLKARQLKPDVLHIHTIGPSMLAPFARLLGLKVVMTNHGPDYDRQKWSPFAKRVLKFGERMGTKFSNRVIVISTVIANILKQKYGREDSVLIYNGVNKPEKTQNHDYLDYLGLKPNQKYIVALGRFVKEKGFHDLVKAYSELDKQKYQDVKLVIAGDCDHPDGYSEGLKKQMAENDVIATGFIKGEKLNQVMSNASLFVLPSYHEGLPIALLEAMSYNIDVLVSDIPANILECLEPTDFFHTGDVESLRKMLEQKIDNLETDRKYDLSKFDWDHISKETIAVYKSLID